VPKQTGKKRISFKIKTNRPPALRAACLFFLYTVTIIRFLYMQKYLSTTWRLWKLLKPFHKDFYFQLFATIIGQAAAILYIYMAAKVLDSIVAKNFHLAFYAVFAFFVIKITETIFSYFVDKHSFKTIETQIQQYLQEYSFKKIFKLNPFQYNEDHSAIKIQVVSRGEGSADEIVSRLILEILPVFTQIIFSIIMVLTFSKSIFVVCLVTLLISIYWSYRFTNYHRPFVKQNMDNWDKFQKVRTESFQHLYLIKIMSQSEKYINKYLFSRGKNIEYHLFTWFKNIKHAFRRRLFFVTSRNISTAVLVYIAYLGQITVGGVYAVWQYINNVYDQVQVITRAMRQLPLRFVELEKYLDIIDKQPEFDENGKSKFVDGDIAFENLTFKYPKGDSNVIENLSINIPQGKKVAFVGHSGSGKTTITRLLLRAYNYKDGSIKISGTELKDIDASSLRHAIGYVEQHVDLFDDTIKNNILFGVDEKEIKKWEKAKIVAAKLEEIAKLARIDEFYHRLGETKFETEIGERGIKLSGGERQRIGIARAIIKDPKVLVFDEATSALDTVNEKYIKEAIDNVSRGRTTIIIAHRLSTVQDSDIIFVMDKGRVVGQGTHEELMLNCKEYVELVEHQELV
jgi:ABC-type multidrug transport system fused ATPase/permease subunit